jgi:hypothetical protein
MLRWRTRTAGFLADVEDLQPRYRVGALLGLAELARVGNLERRFA